MASWFNELAGKAENLLNNIDQSAAEVISDVQPTVKNTSDITTTNHHHDDDNQSYQAAAMTSSTTTPIKTKKFKMKKLNKLNKDDELFEFLNSKSPQQQKKKNNMNKRKSSIMTSPVTMQQDGLMMSSPQTMTSPQMMMSPSQMVTSSIDRNDITSTISNQDQPSSGSSDFQDLSNEQEILTASTTSSAELLRHNNNTEETEPSSESSDFEVVTNNNENQLLKNEILAIHQEMNQSQSRYKKKIQDLEKKNESLARSYEEIKNKEKQLQLELEMKLQNINKEYEENVQKENETREFIKNLENLERNLAAEKKKNDESAREITNLKSELKIRKQESNDYKLKAARILQSKERLISSLKDGDNSIMTSSNITAMEMDEIKDENEILQKENNQLKIDVNFLQNSLQQLEEEQREDAEVMQNQQQQLQETIREQEETTKEQQQEIICLNEEIRKEKEKYIHMKTNQNLKIEEKNTEIERLRKQLLHRTQNSPQEEELEGRLKKLTENLIYKQAIIENLSSERNSFQLQKERLEGQIKRLSEEHSKHQQIAIKIDQDQRISNNQHQPPYLHQALNVVEKFSIRLGIFLRRFPSARLFIFIYMIILHIWVCFILFTYSPEIHDHDSHQIYRPKSINS